MTTNSFKFKPNFFVIYCEFCMNAKTNKGKRTPSPRKKAQTSMEYMIIVAGAIILAILAVFLAMHFMSNSKIGNAESIVAAGTSDNGYLTLALSEPLPTSASNVMVQTSVGSTTELLLAPTPIYVNNYPEYTFSDNGISTADNVTSMSYLLNGQPISVATSTGSPLPIQPISGNVLTP